MESTRREFLGAALAAGALAAGRAPARAGEDQPPSKRYRACVIGNTKRGGYGHGLDLCFQKIPNVTVTAVADPDAAGRQEAARKLGGVHEYADWREMLAKEKPQLLSIGPRWVENRLDMLTSAAQIGASVFMEKPMAGSLEEADAILKAADDAGIRIALAFHALASPAVAHLKKLVGEGLLGDFLEMRARGKEDRRAGGEDLMVLGTHCMYLMRYFAGEPLWCTSRVMENGRDVTAGDARQASEPLGPIAGDCIHASYAFANGVQGHFASQKNGGPGGRFQIALLGSKGAAVVHIGMDPEIYYLSDPLWSPGKSGAKWQPLPGAPTAGPDPSGLDGQGLANKRLVEGLIAAVEKRAQPPASGHEGRAVLEMILAVYASHLEGKRVTFPLKDRRHPLAVAG